MQLVLGGLCDATDASAFLTILLRDYGAWCGAGCV